jgi:Cdc6-like AAA superfamily ATPase
VYLLIRPYVKPRPDQDPDAFLGPRLTGFADSVILDLRRTLRTGRPPKALLWGDFGVGKTHLTRFAMKQLGDEVKSLYVECPPCHRRSRYTELHAEIMRKLGREYTLGLVERAARENPDVHRLADMLGIDADMAGTLKAGLVADRALLWRYLGGERLRASDLQKIDAVSPQIREGDAVAFLGAVSRLVRKYENKQLLIFLDEMERPNPLVGDALTMFKEAIRGLVDSSNETGVIFVSSGRDVNNTGNYSSAVRALADDTIRRRIGLANIRYFDQYSRQELIKLLREVVKHNREKGSDVQAAIRSVKTKETLGPDTYPFTEEALEKAADFVEQLRRDSKIDSIRPNEALDILDGALALAAEEEPKVIDSVFLQKVIDETLSRSPAPTVVP